MRIEPGRLPWLSEVEHLEVQAGAGVNPLGQQPGDARRVRRILIDKDGRILREYELAQPALHLPRLRQQRNGGSRGATDPWSWPAARAKLPRATNSIQHAISQQFASFLMGSPLRGKWG